MSIITEEMRFRQRLCEFAKKYGVTKAAKQYHTNRQFVYRQLEKWDGNVRSLALKSRRPKTHPNAHTEQEIELIMRLYEDYSDYGLAEVYKQCKKNNYTRSYGSMCKIIRGKKLKPKKKRYKSFVKFVPDEVSYPGEKVQIDIKYVPKECIKFNSYQKNFYQITAIDEYSRKRILRVVDEKSTYETSKFLEQLEENMGFAIKTIQVDNGYEFVNSKEKTEKLNMFEEVAKKKGYIIKRTRPYSPWQNGKVERSHREDNKIFYSKKIFKSLKELKEGILTHEIKWNTTAKKVLNFKSPMEIIEESIQKIDWQIDW